MDAITTVGSQTLGVAWPVVWSLAKIVAIVVPILLDGRVPDLLGTQAHRLDAYPHRSNRVGRWACCNRSPTQSS